MKKHLGKSSNGNGIVELKGPAYVKSGQISVANTDSVTHSTEILVNNRLTERAVLLVTNGPEIFYNDMEYYIPEGSTLSIKVNEIVETQQVAVNIFYENEL